MRFFRVEGCVQNLKKNGMGSMCFLLKGFSKTKKNKGCFLLKKNVKVKTVKCNICKLDLDVANVPS